MERFGKITALLLAMVCFAWVNQALAYKIEFSHYGLVNPSNSKMQPCTGLDDTSPFDADFQRTGRGKGTTDIWLTDMDGGYNGCRVYNWTMEENDQNGDGAIDPNTEATWTYNGGFTTQASRGGIRSLDIISDTEFMILQEDGTVVTYSRDPAALGISPDTAVSQIVATPTQTNFNIGVPHHSAYDPEFQILWTNQGGAGYVRGFDINRSSTTFGQKVKEIRTPVNYIEGIAFRKDRCVNKRYLYLYNGPGSSTQGNIWVYDLETTSSEGDGTFVERQPYETGDLPPFHSECLTWDGAHFWMCGYVDGKVYRMTELLDSDCDGTNDGSDNCPDDRNEDQSDRDLDGLGDACDCDADNPDEPGEDGECPLPCIGNLANAVNAGENYAIPSLFLSILPLAILVLARRMRKHHA